MRSEQRALSPENSEFARARISAERGLRHQQHQAAITVAGRAHDANDLRGLLAMLGLEAARG
ncbi:hypothetical protein [Amycolatopsis sp. FDAARGOS 1241]|uniref:hypothetical protein n=1 Tax=Amycolatopsis sp. FDAARGOS 1241 TaxID=2778070 RepID=UPI001950078C|nr:hypothetical protein [Amycolatopsis sp. FDAARGOS 1241]QRP42717.1 hypothetical protein I6J71_24840 [Amycolatopsis sp. FDAARGOS 1241]